MLIIPQLRRHTRNEHTGARKSSLSTSDTYADYMLILVTNPSTANPSQQERVAGEKCVEHILSICLANACSALKLFVVSGGWKSARYLIEPGYVLNIY